MDRSRDVVDVWAQQPTERFMASPWLETLLRWTGVDRNPATVEQTLAAMDDAGVGLDDDTTELFLAGNARRVFNLRPSGYEPDDRSIHE